MPLGSRGATQDGWRGFSPSRRSGIGKRVEARTVRNEVVDEVLQRPEKRVFGRELGGTGNVVAGEGFGASVLAIGPL